jgi:hypothetical protein
VSSPALTQWQGERADRILELIDAHTQMGGTGVGRRWRTQQLNWALILRLAAEFQGFARDLHLLGAETFSELAAPDNASLARMIRNTILKKRQLDAGNADSGTLAGDFGRLGIDLWDRLRRRNRVNEDRKFKLDQLNKARNAIAHDNQAKFAELEAEGWRLHLHDVRDWRSCLGALAGDMDYVVGNHLSTVFRVAPPW